MNTSAAEVPVYQLNEPFFAEDNVLYPPDTEFRYNGCPNRHMMPLNEAARQRLADYLPSIDQRPLKTQLADAEARERARPVPVIPTPDARVASRNAPPMPNPRRDGAGPAADLVVGATLPKQGVQRGPKKQQGTVILERDGAMVSGGGGSSYE